MAERYPRTGLPKRDSGETLGEYIRKHGSIGTWAEYASEHYIATRPERRRNILLGLGAPADEELGFPPTLDPETRAIPELSDELFHQVGVIAVVAEKE